MLMIIAAECSALRVPRFPESSQPHVFIEQMRKLKPKEGMCIQQWSVLEPGLESSPLSPGLPLLLLLWVDGQCRNGERIEVGGSGEGKQGEGSSPLTCSWKESWASASSWKARMV